MAAVLSWLRLKRLTLLQSFILLCTLTLAAVLAVVVLEFNWAESIRSRLADRSATDEWVLYALVGAMLLTIAAGIVLMAVLFYRWKLREPLGILMKASERISANDLGFRISYDGKDEMGELCRVFEKMRGQLEQNYKTLWRSAEERKRLNAIFAHDLRTPLSVLKGYSDLLTAYLPRNNLPADKLLDMIQTMQVHIVRLESYAEAMNSIQKLEDLPVRIREIETERLISLLDGSARQIAAGFGKTVESSADADSDSVAVDRDILMQVVENMVANGARHASSQVDIHYRAGGGQLSVTVADDGEGFSDEALRKAALPFYRGEAPEANEHHGLGLYICKVLCEKHGGSLQLANGSSGGGLVTAIFRCEVDK